MPWLGRPHVRRDKPALVAAAITPGVLPPIDEQQLDQLRGGYNHLRSAMHAVLANVTLRGATSMDERLLATLTRVREAHDRFINEPVPKTWRALALDDDGRVQRTRYELGLWFVARDALRAGRLYRPVVRRYRRPRRIPDAGRALAPRPRRTRRDIRAYPGPHRAPGQLEADQQHALRNLQEAVDAGDGVRLVAGRLQLSPPEALEDSPAAVRLRTALDRLTSSPTSIAFDDALIDRAVVATDWYDALERLIAARDIEIMTVRDLAVELYDDVAVSGRELPRTTLAGETMQPAPPTCTASGAPKRGLAGYNRMGFGDGWLPTWHSCSVRDRVLQRDGRGVHTARGCRITGAWTSPYDGLVFTVGHESTTSVPLAEAWMTGAEGWTAACREAFANDLKDPELVAVSAHSNRDKGDSSPDE
jgi:hypothetical protein